MDMLRPVSGSLAVVTRAPIPGSGLESGTHTNAKAFLCSNSACGLTVFAAPSKVRAASSAATAFTFWYWPEAVMAGAMVRVALPEPSEEAAAKHTNCCRSPVDWRVCGCTLYTPAMVKVSPWSTREAAEAVQPSVTRLMVPLLPPSACAPPTTFTRGDQIGRAHV